MADQCIKANPDIAGIGVSLRLFHFTVDSKLTIE